MSPIDKALSDLHFTIPRPILEQAFLPQPKGVRGTFHATKPHQDVDFFIRQKVIEPKVLSDCNLVGGSEAYIHLDGIVPEWIDEIQQVWHIPMDKTQNREILQVYSIGLFLDHHGAGLTRMAHHGQGALTGAYQALGNSMDNSTPPVDTQIELVGRNTILTYQPFARQKDLVLHCQIANDQALNNLPKQVVPSFCQLVEFAVKAYIYNTLILTNDQGRLVGGQSLGQFNSLVEGYSDAMENYRDHLVNRWQGQALMSDPTFRHRHIRQIVGGRKP